MTVLGRWGYQEIIPPTFEYLDVLAAGLEPEVVEQCYTFADRATGRLLLLRPDVTAQIARIVAMGMLGQQVPLRLCYRATVYRHEPEHAGREREILQVGAELIGLDDVAADAEIIALLIGCLQELGLTRFRVSLGHVLFFKTLLAQAGLSAEARKRAEHAAARKDLPQLEDILNAGHVAKRKAQAVLEVPGLYGSSDILERGRALAGDDRALRASVERLARVYRLLAGAGLESHLLLDLGELRGFDYYDGLVFDVFAEGMGCELGGGGRYNHLIGRFGRELPSTGFALDIDRLFQVIGGTEPDSEPARADCVVVASAQTVRHLFAVSQAMRQAGYRVVLGRQAGNGEGGLDEAIATALREGASAVALLGEAGVGPDSALILTGLTGGTRRTGNGGRGGRYARRTVKIKDLLSPTQVKSLLGG